MAVLSKVQVDALFRREAILISDKDMVPEYRAIELFGDEAVNFACKNGSKYHNGFGVGDFTVMCLTYRGFQMAATYSNVQQLRDAAKNEERPHT